MTRHRDELAFTGRPPDGSGFVGFAPRVPPHPDTIPDIDTRTTWSVEPRRWFGYLIRAHGLGIPEKSTAFAWTRKGAERKALRWSRPTEHLRGAYTPLPQAGRQSPPGTLARGRQPSTTHAKPTGPVPIARERPQPTRPSPMQGETGRGYRK